MIQTSRRDELRNFLLEKGIGTAIHYPHVLPDMKPFPSQGEFVNARNLSGRGLSLPLNPWMKEEEIDFVRSEIKKFYLTGDL